MPLDDEFMAGAADAAPLDLCELLSKLFHAYLELASAVVAGPEALSEAARRERPVSQRSSLYPALSDHYLLSQSFRRQFLEGEDHLFAALGLPCAEPSQFAIVSKGTQCKNSWAKNCVS